jgi:hypothetical protein
VIDHAEVIGDLQCPGRAVSAAMPGRAFDARRRPDSFAPPPGLGTLRRAKGDIPSPGAGDPRTVAPTPPAEQ